MGRQSCSPTTTIGRRCLSSWMILLVAAVSVVALNPPSSLSKYSLGDARLYIRRDAQLTRSSLSSQRKALIGELICIGANMLISLALNVQKLAHQKTKAEGDDEEFRGEDSVSASERNGMIVKRCNSKNGEGGHRRRPSAGAQGLTDTAASDSVASESGPNTHFLRSKLWWLGISLMALGEGGNFASYGFAPASLVAPLGSVALLTNVFIAPVLVKERFAKSDLFGVALASLGAVGIVASSSSDDVKGDLGAGGPDALWQAIKQTIFLVYAGIMVALGAFLTWLSPTQWGDRYILVDVGACAVFGGFTVLSTKGVSSLLSQAAVQGDLSALLKSPLSYVLIVVLVSTALIQIAFLNRALQRFDARSVIPSQFVFFTISAISGSAVLFRDFERASAGRVLGFVAGCLTTFAGVFFLTRRQEDGLQDDSSDEPGDSHYCAGQHQAVMPSAIVDEERQALLSSTPQTRQQRPARPLPAMTTGSVPVHSSNALASSSLPSTSHTSASAMTPRLSLVGGSAIGAGGFLLLATPTGTSSALRNAGDRARPAASAHNRASPSGYGALATTPIFNGPPSEASSTAVPSEPTTPSRTGRQPTPHNGEVPPFARRPPKNPSMPVEDLPAMPLNLLSHFTSSAPPAPAPAGDGTGGTESPSRSQLSGFRWARGSTNDPRATSQESTTAPAGGGGIGSSYLAHWMSPYVPLHSSERSNEEEAFLSLSRWERFLGFLVCLAGSGVCFLFSFLFLLSPFPKLRKFILSFSMGSMLFMVGFSILSGPLTHLRHITSAPRLPFSVAYFGSLGLTLYFALSSRTTIPTLLAGVVQVITLVTYLAAYFPGGTATLRYGGSMAARGLGSLLPI